MSRSAVPSLVQVNKLVDCLEKKPWLATGHARTSHARDRTRTAWQEIAVTLNADGSGCMKTWQQWAKYYKDKKAAIKKKVSQIQLARRRTGGGAAEEIFLSAIEERITALMGGEGVAVGERVLEVNPLNPATNNTELEEIPSTSRARTPQRVAWSLRDVTEEVDSDTSGSETILQSPPVELETTGVIQTERSTPSLPDVQADEHRDIRIENESDIEQLGQASSLPPTVPSRRNASIASSLPRRRYPFMTRRRMIQRLLSSRRQSQMRSLTERCIAIEEKRLETERILAENQRVMINVFQQMAEAWIMQSRALQDLVQNIGRN